MKVKDEDASTYHFHDNDSNYHFHHMIPSGQQHHTTNLRLNGTNLSISYLRRFLHILLFCSEDELPPRGEGSRSTE